MKAVRTLIAGILLLLGINSSAMAQSYLPASAAGPDSLLNALPRLPDSLDVSVKDIPLHDFIRALGSSTGINLVISASVNPRISLEMRDVSIRDLLLLLCRQYRLTLRLTGGIIELIPYSPPPVRKIPSIHYDSLNGRLGMDLDADSLGVVLNIISQASGLCILTEPGLEGRQVTLLIPDAAPDKALELLAISQGLRLDRGPDSSFLLSNPHWQCGNEAPPAKRNPVSTKGDMAMRLRVDPGGRIMLFCIQADPGQVLPAVAEECGINLIYSGQAASPVTLSVDGASWESVLDACLSGSGLGWRMQGGIYLVNPLEGGSMQTTRILTFSNRSVRGLDEELAGIAGEAISVTVNPAMNALILKGPQGPTDSLYRFLSAFDLSIPLVIIDIIITDKHKGSTVTTGIDAGISSDPVTEGIRILPYPELTLGGGNVNKLIDALNGYGWVSLGHVSPEFYISLSALEEQGILNIHSTPRLAALNGSEASLSIGKTEYYVEERNDVIGTQNPQTIQTRRYQPVSADLAISVLPVVTANGEVTLEINVEQSDFTERISADAPPGKVTRSFSSVVRVDDGEMILLGGLEQQSLRENASGWPLLSKVPVLKWIFSSRTRETDKSVLSIFIRPTVIW